MPSIFTRIIDGEIPARMLWEDEHCVAFLDVRPLADGHVLVVSRLEVDHWFDLDGHLVAHLMTVARHIAQAQRTVFTPARVAVLIIGDEVPHTHIHLIPMNSLRDIDFANADPNPDQGSLDQFLVALRTALADAGHVEVSRR